MQVASVMSSGPSLRSEIDGWSYEDSSLLVRKSAPSGWGGIFIGYTPAPKQIARYTCILEMLADGWQLLGPPTKDVYEHADYKHIETWSWWLTRDQKEGNGC